MGIMKQHVIYDAMRYVYFSFIVIGLFISAGCANRDLTAGQQNFSHNENAEAQIARIGRSLDREYPRNLPIFGIRQRLHPDRIDVLREFVRRIDGGSFIIGGDPVYYFDINRGQSRYTSSVGSIRTRMKIYTYTVELREARSNKLIMSGRANEKCVDKKVAFSYPISCEIQINRVLALALLSMR